MDFLKDKIFTEKAIRRIDPGFARKIAHRVRSEFNTQRQNFIQSLCGARLARIATWQGSTPLEHAQLVFRQPVLVDASQEAGAPLSRQPFGRPSQPIQSDSVALPSDLTGFPKPVRSQQRSMPGDHTVAATQEPLKRLSFQSVEGNRLGVRKPSFEGATKAAPNPLLTLSSAHAITNPPLRKIKDGIVEQFSPIMFRGYRKIHRSPISLSVSAADSAALPPDRTGFPKPVRSQQQPMPMEQAAPLAQVNARANPSLIKVKNGTGGQFLPITLRNDLKIQGSPTSLSATASDTAVAYTGKGADAPLFRQPFKRPFQQIQHDAAALPPDRTGVPKPVRSQQRPTPMDHAVPSAQEPADIMRKYFVFPAARIHTDFVANTLARAFDADAFTLGRDIFFASGKFDPSTPAGVALLGHELTHVRQQMARGRPFTRADMTGAQYHAQERQALAQEAAIYQTYAAPPGLTVPPPQPEIAQLYQSRVTTSPEFVYQTSRSGAPASSQVSLAPQFKSTSGSAASLPIALSDGVVGESTGNSAGQPPSPAQITAIAERVYLILKKKLALERERRGKCSM